MKTLPGLQMVRERLAAGLAGIRAAWEMVGEIGRYSSERIRVRRGDEGLQRDPVERVLAFSLEVAEVRLRDGKRELALLLVRKGRLQRGIEHADVEISDWERRAVEQEEAGDMNLAAEARRFGVSAAESMRVPRAELARVTAEIDRLLPGLRALRYRLEDTRSFVKESGGPLDPERRRTRRVKLAALVAALDALDPPAIEPPAATPEPESPNGTRRQP